MARWHAFLNVLFLSWKWTEVFFMNVWESCGITFCSVVMFRKVVSQLSYWSVHSRERFISVLSCSLWDTREVFCSRNLHVCDSHFEMMLMTLEIIAIKLGVIVRIWRLSVFVFYLFIFVTLACMPIVLEWNVIVKIIKNVESYVDLRTNPPRQYFQIPESYYAYNFAGVAVSVLYEWYYKGYCKHS